MTEAAHLRRVALRAVDPREAGRFPFDVPAIRTLTSIEFWRPTGEPDAPYESFREHV